MDAADGSRTSKPSRWRAVLSRVVLYSAALLVGLPAAFCHVLTRAYPAPGASPPPGFSERWLHSDGLRLRAWLGPPRTARAPVVIVHGLGDSLESYLDHARVLAQRGYPTLLVDLRGHGGSAGRVTTLGGREREDVRAALDEARRLPGGHLGVIAWGHSVGAVAVLRAVAGRDDVRAVIVEAPFDTYRDTVAHHAWLYYRIPHWCPIIPIAIAFAEWRGGFAADEIDAVAAARRMSSPLLAIADGADDRMPEAVVRRVYEAHPGPKALWVAPGVGHLGAVSLADYWTRVMAFLAPHGG